MSILHINNFDLSDDQRKIVNVTVRWIISSHVIGFIMEIAFIFLVSYKICMISKQH